MKSVLQPVFTLDGEFSSWRRLYACTPPARDECRRFWWAIESAPWKRVSVEAAERERAREMERREERAALIAAVKEVVREETLEDWE